MQTALSEEMRNTREGREAEEILRRCVHCGFCTATCPTYQILGDELDGPRGRIYLIKQVLEGVPATRSTQLHLDRCLTCRNCETTCPSGVQYGRLVDIGRELVARQVPRPATEQALRTALKEGVTSTWFAPAVMLGQAFASVLPRFLRDKLPAPTAPQAQGRLTTLPTNAPRVLLLAGCVQPSLTPNIQPATERVLAAVGIRAITAPKAGCCGAIRQHLDDHSGALNDARRNIDAWWPLIESGVEALVMNASGCGSMVKDYGHLLRHDPVYAEKAAKVATLTVDLAEYLPLHATRLREQVQARDPRRLTYHPPCSLQHGQQVRGAIEQLLRNLGFEVQLPADSHLCCGSAGTYSLLQPELANELRQSKLAAIAATKPEVVVSANVGCICHLQAGTATPVRHWVEVLADALSV
ncbi:MAG TPA: glycolate oxidase subunit GlcF [Rhodocyclaceae bacterium]